MKSITAKNDVEKRIVQDKYFLAAIQTGKKRVGHPEGLLRVHIEQMLAFIDQHYAQHKWYNEFRIVALLHDIGKLAFLLKRADLNMNDDIKENTEIIDLSKEFEQRFVFTKEQIAEMDYIRQIISKPDHDTRLFSKHAIYSYNYAKELIPKSPVLPYIRYHDIPAEFFYGLQNRHTFDKVAFEKMCKKTNPLFCLLFSHIDSCNRNNESSFWFQEKLLELHLIDKKYI